MTRVGSRRVKGVNIHDMNQLMDRIRDAAEHSRDKDTAAGRLYYCLESAIESARENDNGFSSCSTGDVLSTATLDADAKTLIVAEFAIFHTEYRDEEAFKS